MHTDNRSGKLKENTDSLNPGNPKHFDIGALLPYPEIIPNHTGASSAHNPYNPHRPEYVQSADTAENQNEDADGKPGASGYNYNFGFNSGSDPYPDSDTPGQGKKPKNSGRNETAAERPDGSVTTKHAGVSVRTITIAGQIEGHIMLPQGTKATRYELIIPQIVEIEEDPDTDALLLIINTVGGDVEAGLALSELISGMKKPTASLVLGGGHSIGVPLAVCTDRSFIVPTATMTLHPVRISGLVLGAPQTSVMFTRMQERIVSFVCSHSRLPADRFRELMLSNEEMTTDLGTVLDGSQAVGEGLIDSIGGLSDALGYLEARVKGLKVVEKGTKTKSKASSPASAISAAVSVPAKIPAKRGRKPKPKQL